MVTNRHIGSPVERVEDLRFLRGRGEYIDDVEKEGQLYAVVLRSQIAHGRIRSIDTKPALRMPGVHSVITAADIGSPVPTVNIRLQPMPSLVPFQQPVMAHGKVRYVGEPIALVLADSVAMAEDAAERDRGRHRSAAGDHGPPCVRARRDAAVRATRQQSAGEVHGGARRCDCGVPKRALHPARGVPRQSSRRGSDGTARSSCRMGREQGPAHAAWRREGRVLQSPHAGGEARARRRQGRSRRERCRRRLRCTRRVLPGGFPDSRSRRAAPGARSNGPRIAART